MEGFTIDYIRYRRGLWNTKQPHKVVWYFILLLEGERITLAALNTAYKPEMIPHQKSWNYGCVKNWCKIAVLNVARFYAVVLVVLISTTLFHPCDALLYSFITTIILEGVGIATTLEGFPRLFDASENICPMYMYRKNY